ncbi:MAG: FxDxF family PEP-CTERM protein [Steroidobacteraceae bacterium]
MRLAAGFVCSGLFALAAFGLPAGVARAGTLTLTCELLSTGTNPACPGTAPVYAVPGQYNYAQSFTTPAGSTPITGSNIYGGPAYNDLGTAGFIDDYFFQISPAQADVVSATIDLGGVFSIGNLFARVYTLAANAGGLVTTMPAGPVDYATVTPSGPVTLVQINPTMLTAGSYVLEITGTTTGTNGGSYTGTLNLTAVPLPATLPLLLAGLCGLALCRGPARLAPLRA